MGHLAHMPADVTFHLNVLYLMYLTYECTRENDTNFIKPLRMLSRVSTSYLKILHTVLISDKFFFWPKLIN